MWLFVRNGFYMAFLVCPGDIDGTAEEATLHGRGFGGLLSGTRTSGVTPQRHAGAAVPKAVSPVTGERPETAREMR